MWRRCHCPPRSYASSEIAEPLRRSFGPSWPSLAANPRLWRKAIARDESPTLAFRQGLALLKEEETRTQVDWLLAGAADWALSEVKGDRGRRARMLSSLRTDPVVLAYVAVLRSGHHSKRVLDSLSDHLVRRVACATPHIEERRVLILFSRALIANLEPTRARYTWRRIRMASSQMVQSASTWGGLFAGSAMLVGASLLVGASAPGSLASTVSQIAFWAASLLLAFRRVDPPHTWPRYLATWRAALPRRRALAASPYRTPVSFRLRAAKGLRARRPWRTGESASLRSDPTMREGIRILCRWLAVMIGILGAASLYDAMLSQDLRLGLTGLILLGIGLLLLEAAAVANLALETGSTPLSTLLGVLAIVAMRALDLDGAIEAPFGLALPHGLTVVDGIGVGLILVSAKYLTSRDFFRPAVRADKVVLVALGLAAGIAAIAPKLRPADAQEFEVWAQTIPTLLVALVVEDLWAGRIHWQKRSSRNLSVLQGSTLLALVVAEGWALYGLQLDKEETMSLLPIEVALLLAGALLIASAGVRLFGGFSGRRA